MLRHKRRVNSPDVRETRILEKKSDFSEIDECSKSHSYTERREFHTLCGDRKFGNRKCIAALIRVNIVQKPQQNQYVQNAQPNNQEYEHKSDDLHFKIPYISAPLCVHYYYCTRISHLPNNKPPIPDNTSKLGICRESLESHPKSARKLSVQSS